MYIDPVFHAMVIGARTDKRQDNQMGLHPEIGMVVKESRCSNTPCIVLRGTDSDIFHSKNYMQFKSRPSVEVQSLTTQSRFVSLNPAIPTPVLFVYLTLKTIPFMKMRKDIHEAYP
jgi:hypothetical protein